MNLTGSGLAFNRWHFPTLLIKQTTNYMESDVEIVNQQVGSRIDRYDCLPLVPVLMLGL